MLDVWLIGRGNSQKTVGAWNLVQIEDGLEGFTLRLFTQTLGWKSEEVQVLLANVRKDLRNPKIHAQFDLYVFSFLPCRVRMSRGANGGM